MKFEHALIIVIGTLIIVVLALITVAPDKIPLWEQIDMINQQAVQAKQAGDQDELVAYQHIMEKKLQKAASDALEMPITRLYLDDITFPFAPAEGFRDMDLPDEHSICDVIPHMHAHLQNIRNASLFQMFEKKYSGYEIEMSIMDERRSESMVHYGFVAFSDDGNYTAMMSFHGDSCSDKILDIDKYLFACSNKVEDEFLSTSNQDDILASFGHEEFCVIPLDPWRQAVYDYGNKVSAKMQQLHQNAADMDKSYESVMGFQEEMNRLGELRNLTGLVVSGNFDGTVIQERMQDYVDRFGSFPDEFLELIEQRK